MSHWLNHYCCSECGHAWAAAWDCQCDDRCPECHASTSPHTSTDLDEVEPSQLALIANDVRAQVRHEQQEYATGLAYAAAQQATLAGVLGALIDYHVRPNQDDWELARVYRGLAGLHVTFHDTKAKAVRAWLESSGLDEVAVNAALELLKDKLEVT